MDFCIPANLGNCAMIFVSKSPMFAPSANAIATCVQPASSLKYE